MILLKIFKFVLNLVEWLILLALILYPWVVLGTNPFIYYWNELIELWDVASSYKIVNKIVGVFN